MSSDRTVSRRAILKGAAIGSGALLLDRVGLATTLQTSTPSTDVSAYVLPSAPGVEIAPILTVGDAAENGYRMVGIPDGLGAIGNGRTFSLFMNHELTASAGSSGPASLEHTVTLVPLFQSGPSIATRCACWQART